MKRKENDTKDLKAAAALLTAALVLELIGFFASNSLGLLADSLFVLSELLFFAMVLQKLKSKNITAVVMFLSLAVLLAGLSILYLASYRFVFGSEVRGFEMMLFASCGLVLSTASIRKAREHYRFDKLETKASFVHVLRKTLSSALVTAGAVWIVFTGEVFADYFFGALVGFMVMFETLLLFRDSACMLLGDKKTKTYLFKNVIQ